MRDSRLCVESVCCYVRQWGVCGVCAVMGDSGVCVESVCCYGRQWGVCGECVSWTADKRDSLMHISRSTSPLHPPSPFSSISISLFLTLSLSLSIACCFSLRRHPSLLF